MEILIRVVIRFLILSPIGRIYLFLKYRSKEKVSNALEKDYQNRYSNVGIMMFYKSFGLVFLVLISILVIGSIVSIIKFGFID